MGRRVAQRRVGLAERIIQKILFGMQMQQKRQWEEEEVQFVRGEIVGAKITGYPWWPARITQHLNPKTNCYRVDFFSDNTHAFLPSSKIIKYDDLRSNLDINRHTGKGLRKAIAEADRALDLLNSKSTVASLVAPDPVINLNQKQLLQQPSLLLQPTPLLQPASQLQNPSEPNQHSQHDDQSSQSSHNISGIAYSKDQRQRFVKNLLKKYRLVSLPKCEDLPQTKALLKTSAYPLRKRNLNAKKMSEPKIKRITKLLHQRQTLSSLLSRKIHTLLKQKEVLSALNCKEISLSLSRQLLCGGGPQEVNRLFKWVSVSSAETIANYYENWGSLQSDKERLSNMTTEE